jgi:hypothetical protein
MKSPHLSDDALEDFRKKGVENGAGSKVNHSCIPPYQKGETHQTSNGPTSRLPKHRAGLEQ